MALATLSVRRSALAARQNPCSALPHNRAVRRFTVVASSSSEPDYSLVASQLNQLLVKDRITGEELRQLVVQKWGRSYDVRLHKRNSKMYLQVMWKFLEQQSFPLTEEEYMAQLDAVAEYLTDWGVADTVRRGIEGARARGPGYTGGTSARCISIPLDVDRGAARSSEWD